MQFKQKTLQPASAILVGATLSGILWISCIGSPGASSAAGSVTRAQGDQVASLRLISASGPTNGRYSAGIDIAMQDGAHTYWKQPGDAGVPPVFSFNGSQNVADAVVSFPTPSRINEAGLEAFGYTTHVVFPVRVTPADASKPAILEVDATYAVCHKICVPAHGKATLTLAPGRSGQDGATLAAALADVPVLLPPAERPDLTVVREKGATRPTWTLTWSGAMPVTDIFADAPEGFYFETKKLAPNKFRLTATQVVSAAKSTRVPVALTLARKTRSLVANETLDVSGSNL